MKRCIITISREYGSGGRIVGAKLAEDLGIPFYDKELIQITAEKSGLSPKYIEQSEENAPSTFLYNMASYGNSRFTSFSDAHTNDKTYFAQTNAIRDIAAAGSCVIVGRCADYILREDPDLVRVFICGKLSDRVRHAVDMYGLPEKGAEDKVKRHDRNRANYYKYYTGNVWGEPHLNDIIINTSYMDLDEAVKMIKGALAIKGYLG